MKKLVLFGLMLLVSTISFGRSHIVDKANVTVADTLFYSPKHQVVSNPEKASYYRLLVTVGKGLSKQDAFVDYYMDGKMKAEGSYSFLDLNNDKNSKLDGEVITYYTNGKEQLHGKYVNGLREGYFTAQLKDGSIAIIEYRDGKPVYNYCQLTHPNGEYEKIPLSKLNSILE